MKSNVLVVDDSSMQRLAWVMEFAKCSQVVPKTARNGNEALAVVKLEKPDVLVTDLDMPDLDGEGLVKEVKRLHPDLFVIIVSGKVTPELRTRMSAYRNVYIFPKGERGAAINAAFHKIGLGCPKYETCTNAHCKPAAQMAYA